MRAIRTAREARGWSQRNLAGRASISFKGVQLLERPDHLPRLSSLERLCLAFGLSAGGLVRVVEEYVTLRVDSVASVSHRLLDDDPDAWPLHLFELVDAFRRSGDGALVEAPPAPRLEPRLKALLASTVEALSAERSRPAPAWCRSVGSLPRPWFPSGIENLKATSLVESPAPFRQRNIFVLANFLDRA